MTSIVCCCASPDCMLNGCARLREALKSNEPYDPYEPPFIHPPVGWTCPNCNAGIAPGVDVCPHCAPVKITTTSATI